MAPAEREQLHLETREAWRAWLEAHHADSPGVWLVSWKKATGRPAIGYGPSVEEALCFGWIDSQGRALDDERSMLQFTPRNPRSRWSRPNKERVERLRAAGLMRPAGEQAIAVAQANGGWTALDAVEDLIVPEDLAAALAAEPPAAAEWERFPPSARRAILEWIVDARRPQTRARRIAETAAKAARGERANQWPRS